MHVIPISCDGECPEWTMIEMQGELERKGAINPDEEFPIGQLKLSKTVSTCCTSASSNTRCIDTVGVHNYCTIDAKRVLRPRLLISLMCACRGQTLWS